MAKQERYAVITNGGYGIYVGIVEAFDAATRTVEAREVRHVARWFGRTGGITSLAAHGVCGARAAESRIGAAAPRATLSNVVNIFDCTPEARATFEAAKQS